MRADFARYASLLTLKAIVQGTDDGIVLESVLERIDNDSSDGVRLEALDVLRRVACRGEAAAISACVRCLSSESDEIREVALEVMKHLAKRGCNVVLSSSVFAHVRPCSLLV